MGTGTSDARSRIGVWEWVLRVVLVVATALPLGIFALVYVIDGSGGLAGQTPWLYAVLDEAAPTFLVFFGVPVALGTIAGWALRRLGSGSHLSLVAGPLSVVAYLYALVILGTGLGPFDVRP